MQYCLQQRLWKILQNGIWTAWTHGTDTLESFIKYFSHIDSTDNITFTIQVKDDNGLQFLDLQVKFENLIQWQLHKRSYHIVVTLENVLSLGGICDADGTDTLESFIKYFSQIDSTDNITFTIQVKDDNGLQFLDLPVKFENLTQWQLHKRSYHIVVTVENVLSLGGICDADESYIYYIYMYI